MERNPYTPPGADVEDPAAPVGSGRPLAIKVAVTLLCLMYSLTLVMLIRMQDAPGAQSDMRVIGWMLGMVLGGWITHGVWSRRAWPRIALAAFLAFKLVVGAFWFWATMPGRYVFDNALYLASISLLATAVVLQFTPAARSWLETASGSDYRSRKRLTSTSGLGQ